jgi:hypothetical protein
LAEIHIIEGRIKKAEEYLNAAHWSFLKNNDRVIAEKKKEKGLLLTSEEQLDYKINLHRTFAKLYELKSDFKEAINELKTSVPLKPLRSTSNRPSGVQNIPTSLITTSCWERSSRTWAINQSENPSSQRWLKFGIVISKTSSKNCPKSSKPSWLNSLLWKRPLTISSTLRVPIESFRTLRVSLRGRTRRLGFHPRDEDLLLDRTALQDIWRRWAVRGLPEGSLPPLLEAPPRA